jgi:hypothetical protein|tara:strand:+ start:20 stop:679 length:660 start_codon:yes stop_codon:yes gene_type:complete
MSVTTIPTAGIADDAVGNTKLDLTANYAFTGTISGIPSDVELISTNHITSASVATCDFTSFSTDYNHLILKIADFEPSGNNGQLIVRLQTTGSSGFNSGSNAYYNTRTRVYGNASSYTTNQSGFEANYGVGGLGQNSSGNGYVETGSHMDLYFNNIHSTTKGKSYYGVFWGASDSGNAVHQIVNSTYVGTGRLNALTGIRLRSTSGDVKGRFSLYGVRT